MRYAEHMRKLAADTYAEHRLEFAGPAPYGGRIWHLKKPETNRHWVVVTVMGPRITVVGDGVNVIASGWSGKTAEGCVEWFGTSNLEGYISAKVDSVAGGEYRYKNYEAIAEIKADEESDTPGMKAILAVLEGDDWHPSSLEEMRELMSEHLRDAWDYGIFGKVICPELYYCQAAVRRLHTLLEESTCGCAL